MLIPCRGNVRFDVGIEQRLFSHLGGLLAIINFHALFMLAAALDGRARTEGVGDRLAQRLGPVDHEQQTAHGGKPPFDQILQWRLRAAPALVSCR
jgi:hypothetical protein